MELLFQAYELVERLGAPVAIAAWLTVFLGAIGMGIVLRGRMAGRWGASLAVGALAVAGHTADIWVTLTVSPDLALEGNPIWVVVVERAGLPFALVYGFTGQALVCVLTVQLFAWYLFQRERLYPSAPAKTFVGFVRAFGRDAPRRFGVAWGSVTALFAFLFALLGPYFFYVAFMNSMVLDEARYASYPQPLTAIAAYLGLLVVAYFLENWRAYGKRERARTGGPAASIGPIEPPAP